MSTQRRGCSTAHRCGASHFVLTSTTSLYGHALQPDDELSGSTSSSSRSRATFTTRPSWRRNSWLHRPAGRYRDVAPHVALLSRAGRTDGLVPPSSRDRPPRRCRSPCAGARSQRTAGNLRDQRRHAVPSRGLRGAAARRALRHRAALSGPDRRMAGKGWQPPRSIDRVYDYQPAPRASWAFARASASNPASPATGIRCRRAEPTSCRIAASPISAPA